MKKCIQILLFLLLSLGFSGISQAHGFVGYPSRYYYSRPNYYRPYYRPYFYPYYYRPYYYPYYAPYYGPASYYSPYYYYPGFYYGSPGFSFSIGAY